MYTYIYNGFTLFAVLFQDWMELSVVVVSGAAYASTFYIISNE